MKKIILIVTLLIITNITLAQQNRSVNQLNVKTGIILPDSSYIDTCYLKVVTHKNTHFGHRLTTGSLVVCRDSSAIYLLLAPAKDTSTLRSVAHKKM